jgi:BlaI family penicillinase repressor
MIRKNRFRGHTMLDTDLTKIEVKIMKIIWSSGEKMHLKTITDQVNEHFQKEWKPQTISTYLAHLVRKGYLSLVRSGKVFLYTAEVSQETFFENEIRNQFEYFSEYNLVDFLQTYPETAYSAVVLEKMKLLLNE